MYRTPAYLKKGDQVGLLAPARKITREGLQPAIEMLESWGLKVVFSEHLFAEENQFAGSDAQRAADFQDMLDNPEIRAVIAARGGYGCLRIIDRLNFFNFLLRPKWIVGYSDLTVFHSHVHNNTNVQTLHATMPVNFLLDAESTESLRRALFGENLHYEWKNGTAARNRPGTAEGQLVGGNLSLLYALNPSRSDINTHGKILFLEDLDEYLYHVDRIMLNLKRSWKLNGLAGLIVGGMDDMKDNAVPFGKTAEEIILEHVAEYSFPVAFGFPAGHGKKNVALKLGAQVRFEAGAENSKLEFWGK